MSAFDFELARGPTGPTGATGATGPAGSGVGSIGTALPGSPADGDAFTLTDSLTAPTWAWLLRYVSGITGSSKWVFLGGVPIYSEVVTSEGTTNTATYTSLATAGPSIAVPVAGIYVVTIGCEATPVAGTGSAWMSYAIGATTAADADGLLQGSGGGGTQSVRLSGSRPRTKTLTAVTLDAKYRGTTTGTATYANRWMSLLPVRIG